MCFAGPAPPNLRCGYLVLRKQIVEPETVEGHTDRNANRQRCRAKGAI